MRSAVLGQLQLEASSSSESRVSVLLPLLLTTIRTSQTHETKEGKVAKPRGPHSRRPTSIESLSEPDVSELYIGSSPESVSGRAPASRNGGFHHRTLSHVDFAPANSIAFSGGGLAHSLPTRRPTLHRAQDSTSSYHAGLPGFSQMAQAASPDLQYTPHLQQQMYVPVPDHGMYIYSQDSTQLSPEVEGPPNGIRPGVSLWSSASAALQAASE